MNQIVGDGANVGEITDLADAIDYTDLTTNGAFGSDASWTKGTGWTIAAGVADCDGTQTAASSLSQDHSMVEGQMYKVILTVLNFVAGVLTIRIGDESSALDITANGTYTIYALCEGNSTLYLEGDADWKAEVDNVSCVLASEGWLKVGPYRDHTFHVVMTGVAIVRIEGYIDSDGTDVFLLREATASETFGADYRMRYVMARVTSVTSGSVTTHYLGFRP